MGPNHPQATSWPHSAMLLSLNVRQASTIHIAGWAKGTTQPARGQRSGQWQVGAYQAFSLWSTYVPICTWVNYVNTTKQSSCAQTTTVDQHWQKISLSMQCTLFVQKCTVHNGAMCCNSLQWQSETAVWCGRAQYAFSAIFSAILQCNGVVHSAVDMARVYYLLNKVEWIGQAQAHALKARPDKTHKQKTKKQMILQTWMMLNCHLRSGIWQIATDLV